MCSVILAGKRLQLAVKSFLKTNNRGRTLLNAWVIFKISILVSETEAELKGGNDTYAIVKDTFCCLAIGCR